MGKRGFEGEGGREEEGEEEEKEIVEEKNRIEQKKRVSPFVLFLQPSDVDGHRKWGEGTDTLYWFSQFI